MLDSEIKERLESSKHTAPFLPSNISLNNLLPVGGQGVVYRGLVDGSDAAIKIYFPGQVDKRIEREIKALEELQCNTIVDLLWAQRVRFWDRDLYVVATSFVDGTPLDQLISPGNVIDIESIGIIAYDVTLAIEAMWSKRIVHRDLKPSNILLKPNDRACVIDLGLARHLNDSSLTQIGATWGTLGYLSPEQMKGIRQLTSKSDIFALGVILVEIAMGRHPTFRDQLRLYSRRLHEELPRELQNWLYADLLKQMLHPRPTKRPLPKVILQALARYAS